MIIEDISPLITEPAFAVMNVEYLTIQAGYIYNEAFSSASIQSISFGEGITSIGIKAFSGSGISKIITTDINKFASLIFGNATANPLYNGAKLYLSSDTENPITSIVLDNVEEIGAHVFSGYTDLVSVTICEGVTSIGTAAFLNTKITGELVLPDSLASIGASAFYGCDNLTNVKIWNQVKSIGVEAFPRSVLEAYKNAYYLKDKEDKYTYLLVVTNTTLNSYEICSDCKTIAASAFSGCNSLTDIYYTGSETDWAKINIGLSNQKLTSATIHYNTQAWIKIKTMTIHGLFLVAKCGKVVYN